MLKIDYHQHAMNLVKFIRDFSDRERIKRDDWPQFFGFSKQSVTPWVKGDGKPTFEQLMDISAATGRSIDHILKWKPAVYSPKEQPE